MSKIAKSTIKETKTPLKWFKRDKKYLNERKRGNNLMIQIFPLTFVPRKQTGTCISKR